MKTIIFLNNKGGVGKTATVNTVSHMMAEYFNKKVLLIDLDPQMNCSMMYSDCLLYTSMVQFTLCRLQYIQKNI